MKKFWQNNRKILIVVAFAIIVWRGILLLAENLGSNFIAERNLFLGPTPWANFDGVHYLSIAGNGYSLFQESFFPLFPLLIRVFAHIFGGDNLVSALFLVHLTLFLSMFLLWKLITIDFSDRIAWAAIIFFLAFPTSFYFGSTYTESLFLFLIVAAFFAARKKKWFIASLFGALATATKFVGIFLLPALLYEYWKQYKSIKHQSVFFLLIVPTGLISYMAYLWKQYGDPLLFFHVQPHFGANRSGDEIILLPQVIYRYFKIFITVPWSSYDAKIALLEFGMLIFVLALLLFFYKRVRFSYLLFSFFAILVPTLTGTLSSIPRYVLVAFPLFIILGQLKYNSIKVLLFFASVVLLIVLTSFFLRGYFVA